MELVPLTSYICQNKRANMTRNSIKYNFYLVFTVLLILFLTNMLAVVQEIISDNQSRHLIFLTLCIILIIILMVSQFIIYRRSNNDIIRDNHITNIIHDCKTPITTINLVCQTLDDIDINSEESLRHYSDIIKVESSKLIVMIESILDYIRLNNIYLDYNQRIDVHQTIIDVVNSMRFLIKNLNGEIITSFHADSYYIRGNHDVMLSIISNIVNNAIKYTESSPRIIISTRTITDDIEISIKDNGIGIEEKELGNIFDKTYRVSSSTTNCSGSGFGLYYVKENVTKMKGKIIVISSFGNGSEFRITLPIIKF